MTEWILGVNTAYHEPAACLLRDGRVVAMAEEERFNRVRHGKRALIDNSDQLPEQAMAWCLAEAGIGWGDLAAIGLSLDPDARLAHRWSDRDRVAPGDWGSDDGERTFWAHNRRAGELLQERAPAAEVAFLPHHLCHAASAYLPSPYERAAVLVVDGIGEGASTWLGVGDGTRLKALEVVDYPSSLGFLWEKMSVFLGLDPYTGPGKVMGYGAITDPRGELTGKDHLAAMLEIARPVPGGTFVVDDDLLRFRSDDFGPLERRFGPRRRALVDRYEDASVAAALQAVTDDIMVHLAERVRTLAADAGYGDLDALCLAGGVALNCVANTAIATRGPFRHLWIQPAANDAGTALGAAELLHLRRGGSTRDRMTHAYWGPGFDDAALRAALDAAGVSATTPDDPAEAVAARIAEGQIVAWFQGRQEVGPRALGNRSIVADPTRFDTRRRINAQVKLRESFRPFAPSVLPRALPRFFDLEPSPGLQYMLFTPPLKDRRDLQVIPAVVQENGSTGVATARVQLVEPAVNPAYAALIEAFDRRVGVPMVLNTSFNIGEPIVTTPEQALATFLRSSMDALQLGPYLVTHPGARR
ncbi:MAG: carbamoyl transferase [Deltaproteobacteria bacterium]|nr:MAG: carbamoyl transferase [Deltaproteobacteria bacterium]